MTTVPDKKVLGRVRGRETTWGVLMLYILNIKVIFKMFCNTVFGSHLRAELFYLISLPFTGVFHQKQKEWYGRGLFSYFTLDFPSILAGIKDACVFPHR